MSRDPRLVFLELVESSGLHVDDQLAALLRDEDPWRDIHAHLGSKLFDHLLSSRQLLRAVAQDRIRRDEAETLARHRKRVVGDAPEGQTPTELVAASESTVRPKRASETWSPEDALEIEAVASGAALSLSQPKRIGPFQIEGILGGGGMGRVYRGRDPDLDRPVAIKVIRPEKLDQDFQVRFRAEAKMLAKFNHPNIVQVYRFGEEGGFSYIVMQYVEGKNLTAFLRDRTPPVQDFVRLMIPICEAVEYAHQNGVVHRDLKPDNILIDERGHPFVFDFGLAKVQRSDTDLTASVVVGTPGFIAPELADMGKVDFKSDVYGLGAVLYHGLTGKAPYEADSIYQYFLRLATELPDPPETLNPQVDATLSRIVMKALAKDKTRRHPSAGKLAEALRAYVDGVHAVATDECPIQGPAALAWDRTRPEVAFAIQLFGRADYNLYRERVASRLTAEFGWDGTDKLRVLMVLDELAGNAFEHGCRGRGEANVQFRLAVNQDRGRITVEVRDEGAGFDLAKVLAQAADPAKPGRTRGRGLPMVKRISQSLATDSKGRLIRAELAKTHSVDYAGVVAPPADPSPRVRTVAWKGQIDNFNHEDFEESIRRALDGGIPHVVCDLRHVTYICSSGMGSLFAMAEVASQKNGRMAVVVTNRELREALELFGLRHAVTIAGTPEEAARSMSAT